MKRILHILVIMLLVLSCRKEMPQSKSDYLETAKNALKDSLSSNDFNDLDFARAARLRVDSIGFFALRVPFKGKVPQEDFVFVKTNAQGQIERGKIVHLEGQIKDDANGIVKTKRWDGSISLTSLDRKNVFQSPIIDGYISALHQQNSHRTATQEPQGDVMPEVIITYIRSPDSGYSWSTWFYLQSFLANGESGGGGYYGSFTDSGDPWGGGGSSGGGGGGSTDGGGGSNDPVIHVDRETQDEKQPIDIEKFINCFNAIPDAGATCSIEILADIPVDTDPNKIFDFTSRSPGHTFLNIRKSNGNQSVSQNIGFYPKNGWKTLLSYAPIEGKFVDNAEHEFNCGFKISITPQQLRSAFVLMQQFKDVNYDIDDFNCTDWAMDVFNSAGGNLYIPYNDIPGNPSNLGTRMPNGVYNKLQEMKNRNDPRAKGITINIVKGFAGNSTGPCN